VIGGAAREPHELSAPHLSADTDTDSEAPTMPAASSSVPDTAVSERAMAKTPDTPIKAAPAIVMPSGTSLQRIQPMALAKITVV
jgi:hypothetical protein